MISLRFLPIQRYQHVINTIQLHLFPWSLKDEKLVKSSASQVARTDTTGLCAIMRSLSDDMPLLLLWQIQITKAFFATNHLEYGWLGKRERERGGGGGGGVEFVIMLVCAA